MKKSKMIAMFLAVLFTVAVLTPAAYATSFFEGLWGMFGGEDVNSERLDGILDSIFGGGTSVSTGDFLGGLLNGGGLDDIREMLGGAAAGVSDNGLLEAIGSLLGGNSAVSSDFLNEDFLEGIRRYLSGENVTTTEPSTTEPVTILPAPEETTTETPTTLPPVTNPPVTEAPATVPPVTVPPTTAYYSGGQVYPTNPYVPTTTVPYETTTFIYIPQVSETVSELIPSNFTPAVYDDDDGADEGVSAKMIIGIAILVLSGAAVVVVAVMLKKSRV